MPSTRPPTTPQQTALIAEIISLAHTIYTKPLPTNNIYDVQIDPRTLPAPPHSLLQPAKAYCAYLVYRNAKPRSSSQLLAAVQKRRTVEESLLALWDMLWRMKKGCMQFQRGPRVFVHVERYELEKDPFGGRGPESQLGL